MSATVPAATSPMIDVARIGAARRPPGAASWTTTPLVRGAAFTSLASSFPTSGFGWHRAVDGPRPHRYWSRRLVQEGADAAWRGEDLPEPWRAVVAELLAPAFAAGVAAATGCSLDGTTVASHLWRYEPGCFFAPHRGSSAKVTMLVIDLSPSWDPAWGGTVDVLRSAAPDDVDHRVPPSPGAAEIVVRSESSWRHVTPVTLSASTSRQLLEVSYYRRTPGPG